MLPSLNPTLAAVVFLGGGTGSLVRWLAMSLIGHYWPGTSFPWATLLINVSGSFVMGVLVEAWALVWSPPQELRVLLTVGFLGGFTTFSTFSLDVALLIERHNYLNAFAYVVASVVLGVGALFAALALVRGVFG